MRIIAGEWKGLRLLAPSGEVARPTTDRVKESMFNLMGLHWAGEVAVDLFAGSGALGLEALSRGATRAILVDKSMQSFQAIRENIDRCGAAQVAQVWKLDWAAAWERICREMTSVGWVFLDPPYAANLWTKVVDKMSQSPVRVVHGIVCEYPKTTALPGRIGRFQMEKERSYGDIVVAIYREAEEPK